MPLSQCLYFDLLLSEKFCLLKNLVLVAASAAALLVLCSITLKIEGRLIHRSKLRREQNAPYLASVNRLPSVMSLMEPMSADAEHTNWNTPCWGWSLSAQIQQRLILSERSEF